MSNHHASSEMTYSPPDIRRWRNALRFRYEAGIEYDTLTRQERALFNQLAPDFIGSASELTACTRAVITPSRSA
jgi:hypothetical protein